MAGIRTFPKPYCPACGAQMVLRRPKPSQIWQPFWGCSQWPGCEGTRNVSSEGLAEKTDDEERGASGQSRV